MEGLAALRLILRLAVLVISIVSLVSYYRNKGKKKDLSQKTLEDQPSHRVLSAEESAALSLLYGKQIPPGEPVYRAEGRCEVEQLSVRGGTAEKMATLGKIHIFFDDHWNSHVKGDNTAEIVSPGHKQGAFLLTLNGAYSAVEEAAARQALQEGKSYQKRTAVQGEPGENSAAPDTGEESQTPSFEFHTGREVSPEELTWLQSDYRILACLGLFLFLALAAFIPVLPVKIAATVLAVPAFWLIFQPAYPFKNSGKVRKLIVVSGVLEGEAGTYKVGRFSLTFPPEWIGKVSAGQKIKIEGYPQDNHSANLSVLSLNGTYSIRKQESRTPTRKTHRFYLMTGLIALLLLLDLTAGRIPGKIRKTSGYAVSLNHQSDFDSFGEVTAYPFEAGQYVRFQFLPALPTVDNEYGVVLYAEEQDREADIASLRDHITWLYDMQQTEEMVYITSFLIDNYLQSNLFYVQNLPPADGAVLADYKEDMKEYPAFLTMEELSACLLHFEQDDSLSMGDNVVYPPGEQLKQYFEHRSMSHPTYTELVGVILDIREEFFAEQAEALNASLVEQYNAIPAGKRGFHIASYDQAPVDITLAKEDLYAFEQNESFLFSNTDTDIVKKEILDAEQRLEEIGQFFSHPYRKSLIEGTIEEVRFDEAGVITGVRIDPYRTYDDIGIILYDLLLLVVILGIGLYGFFGIKTSGYKRDL